MSKIKYIREPKVLECCRCGAFLVSLNYKLINDSKYCGYCESDEITVKLWNESDICLEYKLEDFINQMEVFW